MAAPIPTVASAIRRSRYVAATVALIGTPLVCSTTARVRLWPMILSRNWLARFPSANA